MMTMIMTGRCVNKPVQTEPVGCYENTFISNFTQLCVNTAIILCILVCFAVREEEQN